MRIACFIAACVATAPSNVYSDWFETVEESAGDTSWIEALQPFAVRMDDMPLTADPRTRRWDWQGYDYTRTEYGIMSPIIRKLAEEQLVSDHILGPYFAPLLHHNIEHCPITVTGNQFSKITIGDRVIGRTELSVVLPVESMPDVVVKYQADCGKMSPIHPLLRDAWFQHRLQSSGIVPTVHYISPPARLTHIASLKTSFFLDAYHRAKCIENGGTVRFMIIQRIEFDLYRLGRSTPDGDFNNALEVLRVGMKGLEEMHATGIVHGDVHPGNLAIGKFGSAEQKLVFMDFGLATHIEEAAVLQDHVAEPLSYIHWLYSPWELWGFRGSFRDDAYRLLIVVAYLMNGPGFMDYCNGLNGEEMLRFKRHAILFMVPSQVSPFEKLAVNGRRKRAIRDRFLKILAAVRSIENINDIPNYQFIQKHVEGIRSLLNSSL